MSLIDCNLRISEQGKLIVYLFISMRGKKGRAEIPDLYVPDGFSNLDMLS